MSQTYIEELNSGQCFILKDEKYIITCDYKKDQKACINLENGTIRWFKFDTAVEPISIYIIDDNSNFMPVKEERVNDSVKNQKFS